MRSGHHPVRLTARQEQVLDLRALEWSYARIADRLGVKPGTVRTHAYQGRIRQRRIALTVHRGSECSQGVSRNWPSPMTDRFAPPSIDGQAVRSSILTGSCVYAILQPWSAAPPATPPPRQHTLLSRPLLPPA